MSLRKGLLILGMLFSCFLYSQNKQILYGFAEMPHTLMVNPGAETNFRFHAGIPMLSGNSFQIGASTGSIADLFLDDGAPINSKFEILMGKLTERDFLGGNIQIEVLNGGYRLSNKAYLSFGFYQELDFIGYYPQDLTELLYRGNAANVNRTVHFSEVKFRSEFLGVLHAGISYKLNKKLNVGGRFKLYSGSLYAASKNNSGTFNTIEGQSNIYRHHLNNINYRSFTSGLLDENNKLNIGIKDALSNTILSKNIGIGIDAGFTYHYSPQIEITGSILDVGFVSYTKNNNNLSITGDYQFDGIELLYDSNNNNYWDQLDSDFRANVPRKTNEDSFIAWRPIKLNAAIKYSFGRARTSKECYDETYKDYYNNSVGLQLYSITRPLSSQLAATLFLEKSIGEKFHVKFTYTADDYSFSNVGVGISTHFGKFHMYGLVDNVLKFSDFTEANTASLQFGFNLIFD